MGGGLCIYICEGVYIGGKVCVIILKGEQHCIYMITIIRRYLYPFFPHRSLFLSRSHYSKFLDDRLFRCHEEDYTLYLGLSLPLSKLEVIHIDAYR